MVNNNNARFLSAYNRLDNFLQSIVKTTGHVNMIWYLEKISPEEKRSKIQTVRQFKNVIKSHGVNPGFKEPTVPVEWISWLLRELEWCKKNSKKIAPKLQKELDSRNMQVLKINETSYRRKNTASSGYVVYILNSRGRGYYFIGYQYDTVRYGFLNLKKETVRSLNRSLDIANAKVFPTRGAAEFIANELRKEHPKAHISVIKNS